MSVATRNLKLNNRRTKIRELLLAGDIEEAGRKSAKWNLPIEDCKVEAHWDAPEETAMAEPIQFATKKAAEQTLPPEPEPDMSAWPKRTTAYVYAYPVNNRMILIKLEDGRKAHFWRSSNQQYPIGAKLEVELMDRVGPEAYYELAY